MKFHFPLTNSHRPPWNVRFTYGREGIEDFSDRKLNEITVRDLSLKSSDLFLLWHLNKNYNWTITEVFTSV